MTVIWPDAGTALAHARHLARRPLKWDPVSHLLSRFAFGATASDREWLAQNGPDAWWSAQVELASRYPAYTGLGGRETETGPLLSAGTPAQLLSAIQDIDGGSADSSWYLACDQLSATTIALQVWSPAQLFETLVDFWANHLNVANHDSDLWVVRPSFDRDVVRKYATGSFSDMLTASARHPAMLQYLNLAQSNKTAINENYGRELLELHTVGLHYSQSDVTNAATLLTGRTYSHSTWDYVYNPLNHPTGAVHVLGFAHANSNQDDGQDGGDELISYLARHQFTAAHIAEKLCIRYVSDSPSPELVAAVADVYLANGTEILPTVHAILCSSEFWESRGAKVRRPSENLVAAARVIGSQPSDWHGAANHLYGMARQLGNGPLDWSYPNGYPDTSDQWSSSGGMLQQWTIQQGLVGGWYPYLERFDASTLLGSAKTSGAALEEMAGRLLGQSLPSRTRDLLLAVVGDQSSTPIEKSGVRRMAPSIAGLMLHGPHHALR